MKKGTEIALIRLGMTCLGVAAIGVCLLTLIALATLVVVAVQGI